MQRAVAVPSGLAGANAPQGRDVVVPEQTGWRLDEGWLSAILLVTMVLSTIWSINAAGWVDGTLILFPIALAGIGMGLLVARRTWRAWRALLIGLLVGAGLSFVVIGQLLPSPWQWPASLGETVGQTISWIAAGQERSGLAPPAMAIADLTTDAVDFALRIATWTEVAYSGRTSTDNAIFLLLMALLAWTLGYIGAWGLFRLHDVVIASLPTGIALVTNASYTGEAQAPFAIFLISLLLLAVSINLYALRSRWDRFSVDYPAELLFDVVVTSFAVICVLALISMLGPRVTNNPLSQAFWRFVGEQWIELENVSNRLFAGISSPGIDFRSNSGRQSLVLGGPISLTQQPIMAVFSEEPHYWRGGIFDTYTGRSWRNSDQVLISRSDKDPISEPPLALRKKVRVVVDLAPTRSTLLYAPAEPVALTLAYRKQVPSSSAELTNFSALYARRPPMPSLRYGVESLVPTAGAEDLRAIGMDYPRWVTERYLQLPDVSQRVRELSVALTRGRPTVYDQVVAIEQFIRRYPYTLNTTAAPQGRDSVEYFLFETKEGYCDYFASAMVVLLRLQGIPSRIATGFVPGHYESATGRFLVTEEESHSWPEVYFPEVGWIPFEPSGYRPPITRPDASQLGALSDSFDEFEEDLDELAEMLGLFNEELDATGSFIDSALARRPRLPNLWPVALALVGVIALYRLIGLLRERRMPARELIQRIYRRMVFMGTLFGHRRRPEETPLEYAGALTRGLHRTLDQERNAWLTNVVSVPEQAAQRIAQSYVRTQYGQRVPAATERAQVERAWTELWWHLPLLLLSGCPIRAGRRAKAPGNGSPPTTVDALERREERRRAARAGRKAAR